MNLNTSLPYSVFVLIIASIALTSTASSAPKIKRYELAKFIPTGIRTEKSPVSEENMDLCSTYLENLNSHSEVTAPFVCSRPLNPKFTDFSKPKWRELDPERYLDFLLEVSKYRNRNRPYAFDEVSYRKGIQTNVQLGRIKLRITAMDIVPSPLLANQGPDGSPDKVVQIVRGDPNCDPMNEETRRFPPNRDHIIVDKDMKILGEFSPLKRGMDPFLYKGRVYFDSFFATRTVDADYPEFDVPDKSQPVLDKDRYEIILFKPRSNQTISVCRFRYIE